jgi:TM2 domain-containing membrane protein YozV
MAGEKSKVVYGILAILLGALGIHKFYLGDTKNGVIYLLITVCTLTILAIIPGILGLISGIMALIKSDAEFAKYASEKNFL